MDDVREDAAEAMRRRLRERLQSALRARDALTAAVMRTTIAAIDNAQAVALAQPDARYQVRTFGEAGVEVPRRELAQADVDALLAAEVAQRLETAHQFERHGQGAAAARLRDEASVLERYLK